jgi:hypothetical protein
LLKERFTISCLRIEPATSDRRAVHDQSLPCEIANQPRVDFVNGVDFFDAENQITRRAKGERYTPNREGSDRTDRPYFPLELKGTCGFKSASLLDYVHRIQLLRFDFALRGCFRDCRLRIRSQKPTIV